MNKLTIDNVDVHGKRVLVRADFNVPLNENGEITDDKRIMDSLPTLIRIIVEGGKLILMSHFGRPKGKVNPEFSLKPVAEKLKQILPSKVTLAPDCIGPEVEALVNNMNNGDVVLLENLRFHPGETAGDEEFAKKLASLGDIYINNAFGVAHRPHASVSVVTRFFDKAVAGYLMVKEMEYIGETMRKPKRPFAAILAGVKIDGKIDVINKFLDKADKIFVAGGIANTLLLAKGFEVGNSVVEPEKLDVARAILDKAERKNVKLFLPKDMLCGREFKNDTERKYFDFDKQEPGWIAMGIGPKTVDEYKRELSDCRTIIWNGPVSVFEFDNFAKETFDIVKIVADLTQNNGVTSVIGGGDTAAALKKAGISTRFSHISTGGGASLEYMEGKKLPGIETITNKGIDTLRRFLIAGNWKMNKNVHESIDFSSKLKSRALNNDNVDIVIAPTYTSLYPVNERIKDSHIELGSQDIFWEDSGAFTGQVSADMLKSCGVRYNIIGHSERRQFFFETDVTINKKVKKSLKSGFKPILCVGETLEERERGLEKDVIRRQITEGLKGIVADDNFYLIVAYEPVWAIGTGKTATPEQAEEIHKFIREVLSSIYNENLARSVRILYGGSLKPANAFELLSQPNIDGGLIGGAALKVADFSEIVSIAAGIVK
ncbi:MAG: triose-phosphate isomerase [Candidatus Cloacimonadota bacterium]|nr:MAG: triose-phosphate isomerase [Candidatus Cloacimonadota bacterium]PIE77972.1 MAG: triose-phosphate isomerase [Candidatus Delongbacteria bacterium]